MDPYSDLQAQANPFRKVIVMLNAVIPVLCVVGLLAGGVMIMCRKKLGYYIACVSLAGLAVRMFIFS